VITKRILTVVGIVAVSASAALAGTKYQATIVTSSGVAPAVPPTLSAGKVSVKDTGDIKVGVKGVDDGTGPVTTSTSFKDTATLDGTEYVAIVKFNFTALNADVEVAVPMDVKKGTGKGAVSLGGLTSLIPAGVGRSLEVTGGEVWGPLGAANVTACTAELTTGYALGASTCKQGVRIGVAGINVP
jgi:hypothetical protein